MNIPARYCTGYLGDSARGPAHGFQRVVRFDAGHNTPRICRIFIARGRDTTDVAIVTSFGPASSWLQSRQG
jgi:transglutaminase-like putative cysteine protease